jgi:hypothetical protein
MRAINTCLLAILILVVFCTSESWAIFEFPKANPLAHVDQRTLNQLQQINIEKVKKSIILAEKSINSSEK